LSWIGIREEGGGRRKEGGERRGREEQEREGPIKTRATGWLEIALGGEGWRDEKEGRAREEWKRVRWLEIDWIEGGGTRREKEEGSEEEKRVGGRRVYVQSIFWINKRRLWTFVQPEQKKNQKKRNPPTPVGRRGGQEGGGGEVRGGVRSDLSSVGSLEMDPVVSSFF
jgi:hypothetical protein